MEVVGVCLKEDTVYTTQPDAHKHTTRSRGLGSNQGLIDLIRKQCDSLSVYGNVYLSVCFSVFNIPRCSFLGNTVCFLWGDHWGPLVSMLSTPKHTPCLPACFSRSPSHSSLSLCSPLFPPAPFFVLWRSAPTTLFLIWKVSPFHAGHSSPTDQSGG